MYKPPTIVAAIRNMAQQKGIDNLAATLRTPEVANLYSIDIPLIGSSNIHENMYDALKHLDKKNYLEA
ncbi:hypothetical protein HK096_011466 [Nowakowskiella sp. JEL0078]|nr:hypothetical protein HK096_011466 [Nowakowskiella sp. JEL0078]